MFILLPPCFDPTRQLEDPPLICTAGLHRKEKKNYVMRCLRGGFVLKDKYCTLLRELVAESALLWQLIHPLREFVIDTIGVIFPGDLKSYTETTTPTNQSCVAIGCVRRH
jgi:hypothetical protein